MEFKQFLIDKLILFFMLTTLIRLAVVLVGSAFDAEASFGYDAMLAPLRYAGLCVLPTFVTCSKRELKPKEMILRTALEFLLIEAVVLVIAFESPAIDTGRISVVLVIAGSVFAIFLMAHLFTWLKKSLEAKRINQDLANFQKLHEKSGL